MHNLLSHKPVAAQTGEIPQQGAKEGMSSTSLEAVACAHFQYGHEPSHGISKMCRASSTLEIVDTASGRVSLPHLHLGMQYQKTYFLHQLSRDLMVDACDLHACRVYPDQTLDLMDVRGLGLQMRIETSQDLGKAASGSTAMVFTWACRRRAQGRQRC